MQTPQYPEMSEEQKAKQNRQIALQIALQLHQQNLSAGQQISHTAESISQAANVIYNYIETGATPDAKS